MATRPNIVLICTDQWRGDCLGINGHPVVDTPYLDQLAARGRRFRRAYAATPTCIPARASLLTGLSQEHTGLVGYRAGVPWDYPVTLAGEFARHGYHTHCVGKMHIHPERALAGFHSIDLHDGFLHNARQEHPDLISVDDYVRWLRDRTTPDADYFDTGVNCNAYTPHPWDKAESLHPTSWVVTKAAEFLQRRDPTKPFFLKASFHRPHPPLDPPQWAYEQYLDGAIPAPVEGDWVERFMQTVPNNPRGYATGVRRWPTEKIRRARAAYYAHLTHIDHQINRLMEFIQQYQVGPTWYCFLSDHGDMLGDHCLYGKMVGYEPSARVPLVLWGPADGGVAAGEDVDHVVELRDVMPTLLDCAGLPIPQGLDGRSFLPLARGQNDPQWRSHLHGEHPVYGKDGMQYIVDRRYKYLWYTHSGLEQLFDLVHDPQEMHDLSAAPDHQAILHERRGRLVAALRDREEGYVRDGQLVTGRPVQTMLDFLALRTGLAR